MLELSIVTSWGSGDQVVFADLSPFWFLNSCRAHDKFPSCLPDQQSQTASNNEVTAWCWCTGVGSSSYWHPIRHSSVLTPCCLPPGSNRPMQEVCRKVFQCLLNCPDSSFGAGTTSAQLNSSNCCSVSALALAVFGEPRTLEALDRLLLNRN